MFSKDYRVGHICGASGYCPGPPHYDPICSGCLLAQASADLRERIDNCRKCSSVRLCAEHYAEVESS